jgi:hypothetical protein
MDINEFSFEEIREISDRIDWDYISKRQKLLDGFIMEFVDRVERKPNERNIDDLHSGKLDINEVPIEKIKEIQDKVDWRKIFYNQKLSEGFIREFSDKVSWKRIFYYQDLSEEFICEFYDRVSWNTLDEFNKINRRIFEKMNRGCKLYMLMNYKKVWENYNGR